MHHSDRGSQYTATDYRELLAQYGIVVSMSGSVDRQSFASRAQARQVIFEYLEAFYDRQRLHSSLEPV
ncbi:MAG: hypothetical protein NVS4B9_36860 [Ktedonobacteraceae bacterium]